MINLITDYIDRLKNALDNLNKNEVENFINELIKAKNNDKNIFIMGNGGSASTASHFACDIAKGVSYLKERKFKIISLNDNIPMMMAYANDVSYEDIFVEQLKNLFKKGDVVIGISGSGNSKNILKAIEYANKNDGVSIGITGYNGGKLKEMSNFSVNTNINDMQISEDIHLILVHITMQALIKAEA